jgi:superfamily II DNA helicase RecQ
MRLNTDRPNIHLVVRRMQHPLNSYEDLAFIIKKNHTPGDLTPPKFLVFFNSRGEAQAGAEYLRARLSPELRDKVKWFHSGMTDAFREQEMHALIIGESYGEGSTDAAGMVS